MKIIREKPCRRRHHRVTAPLFVTCSAGITYRARDWSIGGLRIDDWRGTLPEAGSKLDIDIKLPFQGFEIGFVATFHIVRIEEKTKTVAGKLEDIGEREQDLMRHFVDEIIRGSMSEVDETIARIDVPITPISTKPDPNPLGQIPVRRWPIRSILMTLFYLALGILVFGYTGLLVFTNIYKLEVRTAVVSVPVETAKTPIDAQITALHRNEGDWVRKGDLIVSLANPQLLQKLDEAYLKQKSFQMQLQNLQQQRQLESKRLKAYRAIDAAEVAQREQELEAAHETQLAAQAHFNRTDHLYALGHVSQKQHDEARDRLAQAIAELNISKAKTERDRLLFKNGKRRHHNGKEFVLDLDILDLEIQRHKDQLTLIDQQIALLQDHQKRLAIHAPFTGRIASMLRQTGASLIRGETIAIFERAEIPVIDAFLNQEEVLEIALGDTAQIYLPSLDHYAAATIVDIDRTAGFIDEQQSQYVWRGPKDRSARIIMHLEPTEQNNHLKAGLPAIVVFDRSRSNPALYDIAQLLKPFLPSLGETAHAKPANIQD